MTESFACWSSSICIAKIFLSQIFIKFMYCSSELPDLHQRSVNPHNGVRRWRWPGKLSRWWGGVLCWLSKLHNFIQDNIYIIEHFRRGGGRVWCHDGRTHTRRAESCLQVGTNTEGLWAIQMIFNFLCRYQILEWWSIDFAESLTTSDKATSVLRDLG